MTLFFLKFPDFPDIIRPWPDNEDAFDMINFDGCPICGKRLKDKERKKHDLGHHYDYVLAQCNGDHQHLKEWVKND